MNSYLAKILELGLDSEDQSAANSSANVININSLTEKQTKQIISEKLTSQGGKKKNKRKMKDNNPNGMTEEEMIAEQQRLFQKAREYDYSDEEPQPEQEHN